MHRGRKNDDQEHIMKLRLIWSLMLGFSTVAAQAGDAAKKVKVFILAGQSNMEGKGKLKLAEVQSQDPQFADFYRHLKKDGKWIVRKDMWINFLDRRGNLTRGLWFARLHRARVGVRPRAGRLLPRGPCS